MAISKINSRAITDLTISADDLASGSITTAKLADTSITTAKIENNAVTKDKVDTTVASTGKSIAMSLVFG